MIDFAINGLVAAFVVYVTIIILAVAALIMLIVSVVSRTPERGISAQGAFNYFLAAVILLIFDAAIIALFTSKHKTLTASEAAALDWWMFYVWSPAQIISFFAVAYIVKLIR